MQFVADCLPLVQHDRAQAAAKRRRDWQLWAINAAKGSARAAYAYLRPPPGWRPAVVALSDGTCAAKAEAVLAHETAKLQGRWQAAEQPVLPRFPVLGLPLGRLTCEQLRAASMQFKAHTAITYDGLSPRHVGLLGDCGLQLLAQLLEQSELRGSLPRGLCAIAYFLLGKPSGGVRAIGLMTAVYRVWAKARAPLAAAWEANKRDSYFAAGSCSYEV